MTVIELGGVRCVPGTTTPKIFFWKKKIRILLLFDVKKRPGHQPALTVSVLGIRIRMLLGLPDPNLLVRGTDPRIWIWIRTGPYRLNQDTTKKVDEVLKDGH
jgi:hypothetical protein